MARDGVPAPTLFGYRRSAVNQMLSDRDLMLRQSEERLRAADVRARELKAELDRLMREAAERDRQLAELQERLRERAGDATAEVAEVAEPSAERPRESAGLIGRFLDGGPSAPDGSERLDQAIETAESRIADLAAEVETISRDNARREGEIEQIRREIGGGRQAPSADARARVLAEELATILTTAEEGATRLLERARDTAEREIEAARATRSRTEAAAEVLREWMAEARPRVEAVREGVHAARERLQRFETELRDGAAALREALEALSRVLTGAAAATELPELSLDGDGGAPAAAKGGGEPAETGNASGDVEGTQGRDDG